MDTTPEDFYKAELESTASSREAMGMLRVLGSAGALDAFATLAKVYPEILSATLAYEQKTFLAKGGITSDRFDAFLAGQASISKYMFESLKYLLSVDAKKD